MPTLRLTLIALALAAASLPSHALRLRATYVACPIDGETFEFIEALSGTSIGMYLDFKPYGRIEAPWPLAKCPTSGFVIFKRKFSDEEIARLKPFVASPEYRALIAANTPYYLAARLKQQLGATPAEMASLLLSASWEAAHGAQYTRYATEALEAFNRALEQAPGDKPEVRTNQQLVAGELERRLGRFDAAQARFAALARSEAAANSKVQAIIAQQQKLLAAKDTLPKRFEPDAK